MIRNDIADRAEEPRQEADPGGPGPLVVYFDGSCSLCTAEIRHYATQRGSEGLCFVDVSDPDAETGPDLSQEVAQRRFHVRQADGQLLSGAPAFVAVWETLPAWRKVAWFARLPGVTAVLEVAYRMFLPLRPLLSRLASALGFKPQRTAPPAPGDEPAGAAAPERAAAEPAPATPLARLLTLAAGALDPPPGSGRIFLALTYGISVHSLFAAAVLAMITAMWFGMSESFGRVPEPWSLLANALLLLQFPLAHSLFLTRRGERALARMAPAPHGATLATTTYALIASAQLLALFALWTPSGIIWWRADGVLLWVIGAAYAASWLLLIKASYDAGAEVQSGALGWMSLMAKRRPVFPDMPESGLFRVIRQPIYAAFSLTLWTVPVWTPDQLALALGFTAYCLLAPLLKERRFARRYGNRFDRYRAQVPYVVPRLPRLKGSVGRRSRRR